MEHLTSFNKCTYAEYYYYDMEIKWEIYLFGIMQIGVQCVRYVEWSHVSYALMVNAIELKLAKTTLGAKLIRIKRFIDAGAW